jgi:hypothetical protein
MKNLKNLTLAFCLLLATKATLAQDIDINIISQENDQNDGDWFIGATNCTIRIDMCNNDGGAVLLAPYRIRPLLSAPSAIVDIAPNAQQDRLPPGWAILTNDGQSIRLTNGTDGTLAPGECRTFYIKMIPKAVGGPLTFASTIAWGTGLPPGSGSGPQTPGNDPSNDNSQTTATVFSTLPIKLLSFNAIKNGTSARLEWVTSFEQNSKSIEVEYSSNGISWSKIGSVQAAGNASTNTKYNFLHVNGLVNGNNLYRLKLVDIDGKYDYSNIARLQLADDKQEFISIYPNPAKMHTAISIQNDYRGKATVTVTDLSGKTVQNLAVTIAAGVNVSNINTSNLSSGTYLVRVVSEAGIILGDTQKLVVTK